MIRILAKNLADLFPGVLSAEVVLERHGQVLVFHRITPSDDSLSLPRKHDVSLDEFLRQEIISRLLLLLQSHLVARACLLTQLRRPLLSAELLDHEVTRAEVVPPALLVELVKFGAEHDQLRKVQFNVVGIADAGTLLRHIEQVSERILLRLIMLGRSAV